jgi:hypothetical protein
VRVYRIGHLTISLRVSMIILPNEEIQMARNEKTSPKVASTASKGLKDPKSLTPKQIKSVSAAALTQAPDKKPVPKSAPKKK